MGWLTMGELNEGQALRSPLAEGWARVAELRRRPGYNEHVLREFRTVLPSEVYQAELKRLRSQLDAALRRRNPAAYAWEQLDRAYRDDDIPVIRAWERAHDRMGARRYLNLQRRRLLSQQARGLYAGLG